MTLQITLERHDAQVLGRQFLFDGQLEPAGQVLDYLNTETRKTFPLFDVKVFRIPPVGPLSAITRPEITVIRDELGLIYFPDPEFRQRIPALKTFDRVIAFTPHAILRGNFHRGVEQRLGELFDLMLGSFLVMTDVNLFFTSELPAAFPEQAGLLLINRHHVGLYHPDPD